MITLGVVIMVRSILLGLYNRRVHNLLSMRLVDLSQHLSSPSIGPKAVQNPVLTA